MKRFKLIPIFVFILIYWDDCSAQISRKEMISFYKMVFMHKCTDPFVVDTGWRDEICPWYPDGLDKRSYLEIDSMSLRVNNLIWTENREVQYPHVDALPGFDCVLKHCLDQYDSKDMDKMAKGFARRMKKVSPINYHLY